MGQSLGWSALHAPPRGALLQGALGTVEIVRFWLAVFGLASLVQVTLRGTPIGRMKPFTCMLCLGFWGALALQAVAPFPQTEIALNALSAAGVAYILNNKFSD